MSENPSQSHLRVTDYSLWLMPQGELLRKYQTIIESLSTKMQTLPFEAHITLLGQVTGDEEDIAKKTQEVVHALTSFSVSLESIGQEDFYFRALFARARNTPELQNLHERAKTVFHIADVPLYMPHLSLLYGDFPKEQKDELARDVGTKANATVLVDRVYIYKTEGYANEWYKTGEVVFGS